MGEDCSESNSGLGVFCPESVLNPAQPLYQIHRNMQMFCKGMKSRVKMASLCSSQQEGMSIRGESTHLEKRQRDVKAETGIWT